MKAIPLDGTHAQPGAPRRAGRVVHHGLRFSRWVALGLLGFGLGVATIAERCAQRIAAVGVPRAP